MIFKIAPLFLIVLICLRCTENPLFDDKITENDHTTVKGNVILSDSSLPDSIYVWLEGFNLSTYTDDQGDFKIEIPPPKSQPGGGLNGIFNLYYFVANYQFQASSMLLINGSIQYSKGDINANGQINEVIVLKKLLDIRVSVEPGQIQAAFKDPINFSIKLQNLVDTVVVKTHYNQWGSPSSLVFHEEAAPPERSFFLRGEPADLRKAYITAETTWLNSFLFSANFFNPGNYEVWPYLQIEQEGLPEELLNSIDENLYESTEKYVLLPLKIQKGLLQVSEL